MDVKELLFISMLLSFVTTASKNGQIRQLTDYLRSVDPDFQSVSAMFHILLLLMGIILETIEDTL